MSQAVVDLSRPELRIQARVLALDPGMYIFRYASELPEGQEVCITLQQAPLGKGSLDFFPADGVSRNTLAKLGDCVVIRVRGGAGAVLATEYHVGNSASQVQLRIDRIDTGPGILAKAAGDATGDVPAVAVATATTPAQPEPAASNAVPASLSLCGHIERRGDVTVHDGGWLGTPDSPARLEGFSIAWPDKPAGVDLAYSCVVHGLGKQPATLSGGFAGTRRRAAGIQAVTFGLVGAQQKEFRLTGQVVFSGCPPQDVLNGQELSGPTGQEHLVAIKLAISPRAEALAPRYQSPWEDPTITKIYKAHG